MTDTSYMAIAVALIAGGCLALAWYPVLFWLSVFAALLYILLMVE